MRVRVPRFDIFSKFIHGWWCFLELLFRLWINHHAYFVFVMIRLFFQSGFI
jgi:hypothetical protein